jgi:hypothetical protein
MFPSSINFHQHTPNILVVDNFYKNPDEIRKEALASKFETDDKIYKGKRTHYKFLFPYVKEEFERLLNVKITDWLNQPANGIFQITNANDPLVWHSDTQDYAGAVYLTPDADSMGTSFWRDKKYGNRRPPSNEAHCNEVYSEYNLTHPDNWELVDKVGAVYNRLVLWDAKLIHSASQYGDKERLVQLFFFSIQK